MQHDSAGRVVQATAVQSAGEPDPAAGVWATQRAGDLSGGFYTYLVDVHVRGAGLVRNRVTDPYSVSLNADSKRSWIGRLDSPALKPTGWDAMTHPAKVAAATDMVIYELHVRDFSIGDATVSAAHRGKYRAFTETGSDGMRPLQALADAGLTDVHLRRCSTWPPCPNPAAPRPTRPAWRRAGRPAPANRPP